MVFTSFTEDETQEIMWTIDKMVLRPKSCLAPNKIFAFIFLTFSCFLVMKYNDEVDDQELL